MTRLSSYTPLESLLLFQALQADGVTSIPFNKISDQLQKIPLVRNDATFDSARLEPTALKDLYLGLLKDEAKKDLERCDDHDAQDVPTSPNSRKRRAPTPSLPTVDEAAKHAHLIPKLIHRLYASYREKVIDEIRAEERHYQDLTREVDEIGSGQWDERLRREHPEIVQQETVAQQPVSSINTPSLHRPILPVPVSVSVSDQERLRPSPVSSPRPQSIEVPQSKEASVDRPNHAKIDAVINHEPHSARSSASPRPSKAPATTALPPLSEMAPEEVQSHRAPSQQLHTPQMPPSVQPGSGYRGSPPIGLQSSFAPQYPRPGVQGPSPSPKLQNTMARASPSSSPRPVLPLPPGMKMAPHSPIMHNAPSNHRPPPPLQPHPPSHYSSPSQRLPPVPLQPAERNTHAIPPHISTPPGYPQPYPHYQPGPQPYPQPQQQPHQQQQQQHPSLHHQSQQSYATRPQLLPPHQGGVQLPPFQVGPQEPSRPQPPSINQPAPAQQIRPTQASQLPPQFIPHSLYGQPGQQQPISQQDQTRLVSSIVEALRKVPWPTWKAARPAHLPQPYSDQSPTTEPLSPVQHHVMPASQRSEVPAEEETEVQPKEQKLAPAKPKSSKSTRKSTRSSRAGSAASSAVAESVRARTRSQSVVSHAESQPAQSEPSVSLRRVKDEPSTPAEFPQQEIPTTPAETPLTSKGTRQRRGTLQAPAQSVSKRKRQRSLSPTVEDNEAVPTYLAPRNDVVSASRNLQRMSAVIMNDISTHKHAGPFQKAVREKDVEGYTDIIKRPQDLKSIKAAIIAGSRAISAATIRDSTTDSPSATPGVSKEGGTIMLEKTADLIPPRAIVNSSQLEKELIRMFANAVMFNPGEGGMVQDAREMADDTEAKVRDWRSAERQVEVRDEDDDDSTATGAGPGKRRKL